MTFKGTHAAQSSLHVGHGKKYTSAATKKSGRISPTAGILILAVLIITAVAIFSNVRKYDKHGLENQGSYIPKDSVQKNIPDSIQSTPKTQQLRSVATAVEKNAAPHVPMAILSGTDNIKIDVFRNVHVVKIFLTIHNVIFYIQLLHFQSSFINLILDTLISIYFSLTYFMMPSKCYQ